MHDTVPPPGGTVGSNGGSSDPSIAQPTALEGAVGWAMTVGVEPLRWFFFETRL